MRHKTQKGSLIHWTDVQKGNRKWEEIGVQMESGKALIWSGRFSLGRYCTFGLLALSRGKRLGTHAGFGTQFWLEWGINLHVTSGDLAVFSRLHFWRKKIGIFFCSFSKKIKIFLMFTLAKWFLSFHMILFVLALKGSPLNGCIISHDFVSTCPTEQCYLYNKPFVSVISVSSIMSCSETFWNSESWFSRIHGNHSKTALSIILW